MEFQIKTYKQTFMKDKVSIFDRIVETTQKDTWPLLSVLLSNLGKYEINV